MKLTGRIGNWRLGFIFKPFFFRTEFVYGMTSDVFTGRGEHVLFWDFDVGTRYDDVVKALRFIKRRKGLGRIYLFQSGNRASYRAICLDKMPLKTMVQTIAETPHTDIAFLKWTMIRRSATIRITPKGPEPILFLGTVEPDNDKVKSRSHANVLKGLYGIPTPDHCDEGFRIRMVHYETIDRTVYPYG
jgi:hypothetical protein